MVFLLFALAIFSSGLSAPLYKKLALQSADQCQTALMPVLWFIPLSIVFCAAALAGDGFYTSAILPALLSGFGSAAAVYMLIESLKRGSYTLSVILINLNFYIPILLSWIFLGEEATHLQLFGILILTVAIILINTGKKTQSGTVKAKWALAKPLAACVANGLVNFGIKLRQYWAPERGSSGFFALCYLFGTVFCLIFYIYKSTATNNASKQGLDIKKAAVSALLLGLVTGICYLSISLLSGYVNAATEFTVVTTLSILLSLLVGWVRYKEKLTLRSILSLLCFLGAVVFQIVSY
jgi:EamA-like transporter family.